MNAFHIYCNGFEKTIIGIAGVQSYIDLLRTYGCVGKEIVVTVGSYDPAFPTVVVFGKNRKERREILSAA